MILATYDLIGMSLTKGVQSHQLFQTTLQQKDFKKIIDLIVLSLLDSSQ